MAIPQNPDWTDSRRPLMEIVWSGPEEHVLDAIEVVAELLCPDRRWWFAKQINRFFDSQALPWRVFRGEIIKLDTVLTGPSDVEEALTALGAGPFAGATAEFLKACSAQDPKDTIHGAGKSLESTLKVMTRLKTANAKDLVKALEEQGYLDDLPVEAKNGFGNTVLMCLPFLRNKLGGHGQGDDVVEVPNEYGLLALQLGAALQRFLIAKYLERNPSPDPLPQIELEREDQF